MDRFVELRMYRNDKDMDQMYSDGQFWYMIGCTKIAIESVVCVSSMFRHYYRGLKKGYFNNMNGDGPVASLDEDNCMVMKLCVHDDVPGANEGLVKLRNSIEKHYGPVTVIEY